MKKLLCISILSLALLCGVNAAPDKIEQDFRNPPEATKPWVYWYWISSHISKEGITKDLEAMAKVGIGEAFISNVHDPNITPGKVSVLSDEWWDCMVHAVKEAGRVGVKIGLFNCPGWSMSGGPWVGADKTMRYLVSSEKVVDGGQKVCVKLEQPQDVFQQVSVQAIPTPKNDRDNINKSLLSVDATNNLENPEFMFDNNPDTYVSFHSYPATVNITLDKPSEVRSIRIIPSEVPMYAYYELQYMDRNNYWTPIVRRKIDRQIIAQMGGPMKYGEISESFKAVKSKRFRIIFTDGGPLLSWVKLTDNKALGCIAEVELGAKAILSHYNEKQLGKMSPTPNIYWDTYMWPKSAEAESKELVVDRSKIVDVTRFVDSEGILTWDAPDGEWTIIRTGLTPTGSKNHPVTPECEGWEIDKMSREYTEFHYDNYVGELLRRIPAKDRKALSHVVMDSYEQGPQNWTDRMSERFEAQYGYSPLPWLVVLTGRIVESAEKSDRFLWDLRRLVADMIAKEYVTGMREKANADGMRLWCENYGFGYPGESLMYGGASDDIAGEFWTSSLDLGPSECRIASSCANIYGKKTTSAEAFTSHWNCTQMPSDMKSLGDWAFTQGINHYVFHLYIHQAYDRHPGVNAWFGTDLNRNSTWFFQAKPYYDYIRRASALLQSGVHAADILYYYGEDTPKQSADFTLEPPVGMDYDIVNAEVILNDAYVKSGKIVLGSGISYNILVLPSQNTMRPEVLTKIMSLVNDGATVIGVKPDRSPSLQNYPQADTQVKQMASKLWGDVNAESVTENRYGKGRIFCGITLEEAFARMNVSRDVVMPDEFAYTHRRCEDTDIYFISNQSGRKTDTEIGFNVQNKQPELWNAVTGEIKELPQFSLRDGMTYVPLQFDNTDSWFIVFRKPVAGENLGENFPALQTVQTIDGTWDVAFDTNFGGVKKAEFKQLTDWIENDNLAIKYYSGTAVYTKEFNFTGNTAQSYVLDLGRVEKLAIVKLNGKSIGTLWCTPYKIDVTNTLRRGVNKLEIQITNPWWNRVVGDLEDGVTHKYTWMTFPFNWAKGSPLQSAGLLGPVQIVTKK